MPVCVVVYFSDIPRKYASPSQWPDNVCVRDIGGIPSATLEQDRPTRPDTRQVSNGPLVCVAPKGQSQRAATEYKWGARGAQDGVTHGPVHVPRRD